MQDNLQEAVSPAETESMVASAANDSPPAQTNTAVAARDEGAVESVQNLVQRVAQFNIYKALALDPNSFPDLNDSGGVKGTIPNVRHLLKSYGVTVRYNVISKKLLISVPGSSGAPDNADNSAMSQLVSLACLNGMSNAQLANFVAVIGDQNQFNPVADWINSKPWDGTDRLPAFYDTLTHREGYPLHLKETLMKRWAISAVAAVLKPSGFKARGVLTLQGGQGLGKTSWVASLVPDQILREGTIKLDHHLDAANKDSLISAVSHWIVEIGELDSSFKKDVARLKGFLTSGCDKVRRPYDRAASEYPRRTVFTATVNDQNFLVDSTGNSRFWTIPVIGVNFNHGIDMQQFFAQMAVEFHAGEQWWLTQAEEAMLEEQNKEHRSISVVHERILETVDTSRAGDANLPAMSPTELLVHSGIKYPSNSQCKECAAILREYFGESKRINGINKWRVPLRDTLAGNNTSAQNKTLSETGSSPYQHEDSHF